jgi:hypothetical protein
MLPGHFAIKWRKMADGNHLLPFMKNRTKNSLREGV